jgi:hypothetical protein
MKDISAFPKAGLDHWNKSTPINEGMTLRDYFAAKAMQGMLSETSLKATHEEFAFESYKVADAMMEARNGSQ